MSVNTHSKISDPFTLVDVDHRLTYQGEDSQDTRSLVGLEAICSFEGSEHKVIGDLAATLAKDQLSRWRISQAQKMDSTTILSILKHPLFVENQALSFGDITALAGDFYGAMLLSETISQAGINFEDRCKNFRHIFNTLVKAPQEEVSKILGMFKAEQAMAEKAKAHHLQAHRFFTKTTDSRCMTYTEIKDHHEKRSVLRAFRTLVIGDHTYTELLKYNFDHFNLKGDAKTAYTIGHYLALKEAEAAGKENDFTRLQQAYAIEAFASHFLTDTFASGHMRVPRRELFAFAAEYSLAKADVIGGLLANAQHNEDGRNGLWVSNARGDTWQAFGDGYLFDESASAAKSIYIASEAVAAGICDIGKMYYTTFNGDLGDYAYSALDYIPKPMDPGQNSPQSYPLFKLEERIDADGNKTSIILCRSKVGDPRCSHYAEAKNPWTLWFCLREQEKLSNYTVSQIERIIAHISPQEFATWMEEAERTVDLNQEDKAEANHDDHGHHHDHHTCVHTRETPDQRRFRRASAEVYRERIEPLLCVSLSSSSLSSFQKNIMRSVEEVSYELMPKGRLGRD